MSHLKLVGAPEPPKPKRRKFQRTPILSADEELRFKAALRGLHDAFGSWPCLASAMGVQVKRVQATAGKRVGVSGDMILRAMRASGLSLADLLGEPIAADRCRACGQVKRRAS